MNQSPGSSVGKAFSFDVDAPMVRVSDGDILDGLRRFAVVHGPGAFTEREFHAWKGRRFGVSIVRKRFGSWRAALARIGVDGRTWAYDAEELMANLERIWRTLGRRPGHRNLIRKGGIGKAPYRRVWGSVRRACELLAAHHRGEMTREELLRAGPAKHGKAKRGRGAIPMSVRWRILKRDHHRCAGCGKSPATHPGLSLEIDHIIPVSRGGGNDEANLRTLCRACNSGKGDGE